MVLLRAAAHKLFRLPAVLIPAQSRADHQPHLSAIIIRGLQATDRGPAAGTRDREPFPGTPGSSPPQNILNPEPHRYSARVKSRITLPAITGRHAQARNTSIPGFRHKIQQAQQQPPGTVAVHPLTRGDILHPVILQVQGEVFPGRETSIIVRPGIIHRATLPPQEAILPVILPHQAAAVQVAVDSAGEAVEAGVPAGAAEAEAEVEVPDDNNIIFLLL